jgi:hypothetical protein
LVVRTWEEALEYQHLEKGPCISARTLNLPYSAATIQDAACFPQRLSSGVEEKGSEAVAFASDHLASLQRFIGNLGSGTQQPVPRLRDRMLEQRAGTQAQNVCPLCISCATRAIVVKIKRKNRLLCQRLRNGARVLHIR